MSDSLVKDIMTADVISVNPEMPLVKAVDVLTEHNFNGLPVIDENGVLVGILTDYDLVIKGSSLHLPTFLKLLQDVKIYSQDSGPVKDAVKEILLMKVKDVMNPDPLTLGPDATIQEIVDAFSQHHRVNPIPIVDKDRKLIGILSRFDLVKLFGARSVNLADESSPRELDRDISHFLADFENRFLFVSKFRTYHWLLFSLASGVIGFIIALAVIVRILP